MTLIIWSEEFSVNIREIDHQHKKWIAIINELNENTYLDDANDALQNIFNELVNYTAYHFCFEEKLLTKYGYSEMQKHMQGHSDFIERLKYFLNKSEDCDMVSKIEFMDFLKTWLVNHIMVIDKKYSSFLNSQGVL